VATSFDKNDKSSRRAVADDVRRKQSRAERRKSFAIVGACAAVAVMIIGAAAYSPIKNWWDLRQFRGLDLASIGAPATVCGKPTTKDATGEQQHVPDGTDIEYKDAPPAFGEHYPEPDGMERKLYTEDDRPPLGELVHNLEHGYTILWYDQSIADDGSQMDELRGIADKLQGTGMTHWSKGGVGDDATDKQVGVFQYCTDVSGAALKDFMLEYPYTDSPEPGAA
jgi:hypothetical protein